MSLSIVNEVLYYRLIDVYMKTGQSYVGDLFWDVNEYSMINFVDENMFLRKLIFLRYFCIFDINYQFVFLFILGESVSVIKYIDLIFDVRVVNQDKKNIFFFVSIDVR